MNLRTKFPQIEITDSKPEFRPYYASTFFALSILALVALYAITQYWGQYKTSGNFGFHFGGAPHFFIFPWVIAAGQTINNSLIEFSGNQLVPLSTTERLMTLLGIVVVYVVAPTLFFFHWRARHLEKIENPAASSELPTVSLLTSSALLLYAVIPIIPVFMFQPGGFQNLKDNQAVQSNRDNMNNTIIAIAWDARQYRILPKELGGGGESYKGYFLPNELRDTEEGTYTVSATDYNITIFGKSNKDASATILVHLDEQGIFSGWKYSGVFSSGVPYSSWKRQILNLGK